MSSNSLVYGTDYSIAGQGVAAVTRDPHYQAREQMNCGFLDGHVERTRAAQMLDAGPALDFTGKLKWHRSFWVGTSQSTDSAYD